MSFWNWVFCLCISGAMAVVGLLLLVASVRRALRATERARGMVLEVVRVDDGDGAGYRPVVEFEWEGQRVVLDELPTWAWKPRYQVGERVMVFFPAAEPVAGRLSRVPWLELSLSLAVGGVGAGTLAWILLSG